MSWSSDRTLRVALGDAISPESHARVRAVYEALRGAQIAGLIDVTPAYTTIQLMFDAAALGSPGAPDPEPVVRGVVERSLAAGIGSQAHGHLAEIPVCYEGEDFAPDLAAVASLHGLTTRDVVERHSGAEYSVQFLGFSPGFAYLAGLPAELATPRLDSPRARVPAGSVGIAGSQTGVYPQSTPGGWRLVGRTPIALFDPQRLPPSLLVIGERVRFRPISREQFDELASRRSGA